jgi:hypothetical protein
VKIGDLVQLSAYGDKLTLNCSRRGKVGLVISQASPSNFWKVKWNTQASAQAHPRKDLKHVRKSK